MGSLVTGEQRCAIFERVRRGRARSGARSRIVLALIEELDRSPFELTDEQLAEVRRILAGEIEALDAFDARLSRFGL